MDRRAKLWNPFEGMTRQELEEAVRDRGCEVHLKMRMAGALDIDRSGLTDEEFSYALKAELDFVVSEDRQALFAVEFDGPHHEHDPDAQRRDRLKNRICRKLGMPLLRINDPVFKDEPANFRMVQWLVNMWFQHRQILKQQADGHLPRDEFLDPRNAMEVVNGELRFPRDPWHALIRRFRTLTRRHVSRTDIPLHFMWRDEEGTTATALVMAEVHPDTGHHGLLYGFARSRGYLFGPVVDTELARILAGKRLTDRLRRLAEGHQNPVPLSDLDDVIERQEIPGCEVEFNGPDDYTIRFDTSSGRMPSTGGYLRGSHSDGNDK